MGSATAQRRNGATAQRRNGATANGQRPTANGATAQRRNGQRFARLKSALWARKRADFPPSWKRKPLVSA